MNIFSKHILSPGETSGPHCAPRHTCLCVISGEMTLDIKDKQHRFIAGDCVDLSVNTPHTLRNEAKTELIVLKLSAFLQDGSDCRKRLMRVTVRNSTNVPSVAVVGDAYALLFEGNDTARGYALVDARVPPGGGPPPHIHTREVEAFFIKEGVVDFMVDGKTISAKANDILEVPIGTLHAFKNNSKSEARMLIAVAPSGLEQMFREVGTLMKSFSDVPAPPTQEDIGKLIATAPKYGIELKLPH